MVWHPGASEVAENAARRLQERIGGGAFADDPRALRLPENRRRVRPALRLLRHPIDARQAPLDADGGFGEGIINWSNKNHISNSILTLGVPNRFVDHGPRNVLLEEIGLDSMTLYEKIYNFLRESNE